MNDKRATSVQIALTILMVSAVLIIPIVDKITDYVNKSQEYRTLLENAVQENMAQNYINQLKNSVEMYDRRGLISATALTTIVTTTFISIFGIMLFYAKKITIITRKGKRVVKIGSKTLEIINKFALIFLMMSVLFLVTAVVFEVALALFIIAFLLIVYL